MNNIDLHNTNALVECKNLSKIFYEGSYQTHVLKQLEFRLHPKERVAIIGSSGSGKSTFLHILAGLDRASEGTVSVMNHSIIDCSVQQLSEIRSRYIGFVYQFHHLLPDFSLLENVTMPLLIRGESRAAAQHKGLQILEKLGLSQKSHHKPGEASGGERQRTAVGRAIATQPAFILADEPTGNLDNETAHLIIDILCELEQTSIIIVTHDDSIAKRMDRVLKLENGYLMPITQPK